MNENWLDTAKHITTGERRRDYDNPLYNFCRIASYWSIYLNRPISLMDVAMMNNLQKIARHMHSPKEDNYIDIIGYTSCVQEIDNEMKKIGYESGIKLFNSLHTLEAVLSLYSEILILRESQKTVLDI